MFFYLGLGASCSEDVCASHNFLFGRKFASIASGIGCHLGAAGTRAAASGGRRRDPTGRANDTLTITTFIYNLFGPLLHCALVGALELRRARPPLELLSEAEIRPTEVARATRSGPLRTTPTPARRIKLSGKSERAYIPCKMGLAYNEENNNHHMAALAKPVEAAHSPAARPPG